MPRREARSGVAWLQTLLGALVLCSVGFLAGLVAGVVFQNPGLVAGELAGRSEAVDLAGDAAAQEDAPAEEAAAPAASESRMERAQAAPPSAEPAPPQRVAAAPARPAPDVASPPPPGDWAVQVGSFADSRAAEGLAGSLRDKGFAVYVAPAPAAGDGRWRVRVGPVESKPEAEKLAERLKSRERLPTWVLNESEN